MTNGAEFLLNHRDSGPKDGPPLVLAHSLGTDLHLWDAIMPHLAQSLRIIRFDLRGHGQSDAPPSPYAMGALIRDAETLLDHLGIRDCAFLGLGLGGMVAQGLAVKRLDQMRALILCGTAAKLGQPSHWAKRADVACAQGMTALANALLPRYFPRTELGEAAIAFRKLLERQSSQGYAGCCAAIAGTDFYAPTSGLRLPTLGIAGTNDAATPPDLMRETIDLIPGSTFRLIRRAGHLPCLDQPKEFAQIVTKFLLKIGHIPHLTKD